MVILNDLSQKEVRGVRRIVQDLKAKWKCTILIAVKHQRKEFAQQGVDGNVSIMNSKGLGDSIEKFTKATGIKKLADKIPGGCGCNKRKDKLNNMFPYKN